MWTKVRTILVKNQCLFVGFHFFVDGSLRDRFLMIEICNIIFYIILILIQYTFFGKARFVKIGFANCVVYFLVIGLVVFVLWCIGILYCFISNIYKLWYCTAVHSVIWMDVPCQAMVNVTHIRMESKLYFHVGQWLFGITVVGRRPSHTDGVL